MKRPLYRRSLVIAICISLALVTLPIIATVLYYLSSLKQVHHPDAGLANFILAAEKASPAAKIAFQLFTVGVCMLPIAVILLAANVIANRIARRRSSVKTNDSTTGTLSA